MGRRLGNETHANSEKFFFSPNLKKKLITITADHCYGLIEIDTSRD